MALTTASVVALREENSTLINQLSSALEGAAFPFRGQDKRVAERLGRLFDRRLEIEEAAATHNQREHYGREQWDRYFVRMQEVRAPEGSGLTNEQVRNALWKLVPNGKFKRFQELFADPANYVVPNIFEVRDGTVRFTRPPDFNKISVSCCFVSPDRIPDEFAEKVGVVEWSDKERRSPLLRYLRKADVQVLDRLKLLWDAAALVSHREFRVLVVQRPSADLMKRYPSVESFPSGLHGTILFLREDLTGRVPHRNPILGPEKVRPLRVQHFTTIYDAHRKTLHEAFGYKTESGEIAPLRARGEMLRTRIANDYRKDAPAEVKAGIREQATETLREGVALLKDVVDGNKRKALDLMSRVVDFEDSTGRTNPLVVHNRLTHSTKSLGARLNEMRAKNRHNQTDEDLLREIIAVEGTILRSIERSIARQADALFLPQRNNGTASRSVLAAKLAPEVVMSRLMPDRQSLDFVGCRPFSTFGGLLRVGAFELQQALTAKDTSKAKAAVVKMHIINKLFSVNDNLQRMTEYLVDPEAVPMQALRTEVREMKEKLAVRILRGVQVADHEERFGVLERRVASLDSFLQSEIPDSPAARKMFFVNLKKQIKSIDPEGLAWELVPAKWRTRSSQGPGGFSSKSGA